MSTWPDPYPIPDLSDHQRQELQKALAGKVGILTGCPGAGKTYCLALVMRQLLADHDPEDILVCCPTGKAAVRASESMQRYRIRVQATTIHRALGVQVTGDGFRFAKNADDPLAKKFVIVDEASMLGTGMANSLLAAIPSEACLLLIGDHHQLPSVEPGAVLRDMIASGLPHGDLREIHRNSGRIVECCRSIRDGGPFLSSANPSYFAGPAQNLRHIKCRTNEQIAAEVQKLIESISAGVAVDAVWGTQVITPLNEGTPVARKELNDQLQQQLNPYGQRLGSFRFGDKVMCLRNKFYTTTTNEEEFVCNGQLGVLVESGEKDVVHVTLRLPGWHEQETTICVPVSELRDSWDLAYAISIHKSQGSSWPVVLMVLDQSGRGRYMANRQLVYTGLSRAEDYCVVLGSTESIQEAIRKDAATHRVTGLVHDLTEVFGGTSQSWTTGGV